MLKGYKTYVVAGLAVLTAAVQYLTGDITASAALQLGITAILGATLRSGIANEVANGPYR